jgi:hypothetical protein
MVTFVSLFLWLMTGVQTVEVSVGPTVATVELFLDGRSVGTATAPNWTLDVDFGEELLPHRLVAIASDAKGVEVGRAQQLINLPRGEAEVELALEPGDEGRSAFVRVIAVSRNKFEPLAVFITFDGEALAAAVDGGFALPEHDPRQPHMVSAEAHFPGGYVARADATFGGSYGSLVATELTAIPIIADGNERLEAARLQQAFAVRGEPVRVAAVDQPGGRVLLIRDHSAWPKLARIGDEIDRRLGIFGADIHRRLTEGFDPLKGAQIGPDADRYYLVVPNAKWERGLALFPILVPFDIKRWGLPWLVTHVTSPEAKIEGQRLAEAVAVALVRAAGGACPRVVVVVVGEDVKDDSVHSPQAMRQYAAALRVPLVIWSPARRPIESDWGEVVPVSSSGAISRASRRVLKDLRRQWIVWVEGRHLPSEIEIRSGVEGIRLAGSE